MRAIRIAAIVVTTGVQLEDGHVRTFRADGGRRAPARPRSWPADLLLAQGLHPADQALPRRLPLLHLRRDAARQPPGLSLARRGLGHRPRRQGGRLHRGAVHPGRQARAALPRGARGARRVGIRIDDRLPHRDVRPGAARDRAAAARQSRRHDARGDRGPARGHGQPGHHAGIDQRAAVRERRRAFRLARQASGGAAGNHPARRRAESAVHHRHPDRHRRDARGADRRAARHRRPAREVRPHPGSDRPELPRQVRHQARRRRRARSRRPFMDHRPGATDPRAGHEHPGAAQPVAGRLSAAGRRGPQRLGRRLASHARSRESRSAVACSR